MQRHETKQIYEAIPAAVKLQSYTRQSRDFISSFHRERRKDGVLKLSHVGIDPTLFSLL